MPRWWNLYAGLQPKDRYWIVGVKLGWPALMLACAAITAAAAVFIVLAFRVMAFLRSHGG